MNYVRIDDHAVAQSLLKKLIYFDIFSYPLLAKEVIKYCNYPGLKEADGLRALNILKGKNLVNYEQEYYALGKASKKVKQRIADNTLASTRMKTAKKYAALVAGFPYVRGVFISGSLSKNVMKPDSDIDFFIVTTPGRLWLCRALLTLFKKLVLGDSYRNFCLNYFVDSDTMEIPERNIFTATEIAFLIPMYNFPLYLKFTRVNDWYHREYPNLAPYSDNTIIKPYLKLKIIEFLLNHKLGDWLEKKFYTIITDFWRKKFSHVSDDEFHSNFLSSKHVSKHHPSGFQKRILTQYAEKVLQFEQSTGFLLSGRHEQTLAVK